jgi:hypothetical protein
VEYGRYIIRRCSPRRTAGHGQAHHSIGCLFTSLTPHHLPFIPSSGAFPAHRYHPATFKSHFGRVCPVSILSLVESRESLISFEPPPPLTLCLGHTDQQLQHFATCSLSLAPSHAHTRTYTHTHTHTHTPHPTPFSAPSPSNPECLHTISSSLSLSIYCGIIWLSLTSFKRLYHIILQGIKAFTITPLQTQQGLRGWLGNEAGRCFVQRFLGESMIPPKPQQGFEMRVPACWEFTSHNS